MVNEASIQKEWILIDAQNQPLGRLASQIAMILRGKHKPTFTPHVACGDNVIVINAEKVRLTGKKMTDKIYLSYTGYPGGQRETTPEEILSKQPHRVIEKAVKGMLPKTILGSEMYRHLHVVVGTEHKYEAQKPRVVKLENLK